MRFTFIFVGLLLFASVARSQTTECKNEKGVVSGACVEGSLVLNSGTYSGACTKCSSGTLKPKVLTCTEAQVANGCANFSDQCEGASKSARLLTAGLLSVFVAMLLH